LFDVIGRKPTGCIEIPKIQVPQNFLYSAWIPIEYLFYRSMPLKSETAGKIVLYHAKAGEGRCRNTL
jgi:hypothetical protein